MDTSDDDFILTPAKVQKAIDDHPDLKEKVFSILQEVSICFACFILIVFKPIYTIWIYII